MIRGESLEAQRVVAAALGLSGENCCVHVAVCSHLLWAGKGVAPFWPCKRSPTTLVFLFAFSPHPPLPPPVLASVQVFTAGRQQGDALGTTALSALLAFAVPLSGLVAVLWRVPVLATVVRPPTTFWGLGFLGTWGVFLRKAAWSPLAPPCPRPRPLAVLGL